MTPVITLENVGKTYRHYPNGAARLTELITGRKKHHAFVSLTDISFELNKGEVLGVIGRNGAGKSTLLKILAGTLMPSTGTVMVDGRVAALLELGSGFHPDLSGRENIFLYGAVLGLSRADISNRFADIVAFAGLEDFIDRPVKTYSSGMQVRLAFSVATSVDPDILIIDEALSVGDGAFAHKSFERIIEFKEQGKTIVFCSHSLFQVEAICTRVIWINNGQITQEGNPKTVCAAYNNNLIGSNSDSISKPYAFIPADTSDLALVHRILDVTLSSDGLVFGKKLNLECESSDLIVLIDIAIVTNLAPPSVIVALVGHDGEAVCSAISQQDGFYLSEPSGNHSIRTQLTFPALPLLRGRYTIDVYLMCDRGIHCYEQALHAAELIMDHEGLEQGIVRLPHSWHSSPLTP
ncbi:MAG: ABC transporter ATP-binding protein [Candidatus Cloacimonetes bacterium]|jgi:lipopolysaccharide transport system ATP-binding protein|nr:ABC transporter ATP-binding protein [Candidatus Cloacimonadota bacterium]